MAGDYGGALGAGKPETWRLGFQGGFRGFGFRGLGFRGLGFRGFEFRGFGFRGFEFRGLGLRGLGFRGFGFSGFRGLPKGPRTQIMGFGVLRL